MLRDFVHRQNCWKLNWAARQLEETKFWSLGKTDTSSFPNTIPLGNSLCFPMVHFTTPNGQQIMSYGYRKMAGFLNREKSGQAWPFGINQDFGKILPWPPQKLCIQKMLLTNSAFFWLLIRLILIHGLVATDFWNQVTVLNWFGTEWIGDWISQV
jgi:hypothetical protein